MILNVKLIYFYQFGARGFRRGSYVDNEDYSDAINDAIDYSYDLYLKTLFSGEGITPGAMSKIMLNFLKGEGSI